jgi:pimeloyl-ACP methyl ester carboxylesterase
MHCGLNRASSTVPLSVVLLFAVGQPASVAGVESHETSFQSAGYRLKGTLTGPIGQTAVAGVLIIPGSGPVDRDGASRIAPSMRPVYRQWAERLSESGFAVLRYDKRFLTYPDLDISSFDQEAEIADALSAVALLRSVAGLEPQRIFIIGHSEGGTLAPLVAERTSAIVGVAIINTVQFPVDELLVAQLQARSEVPRSKVEEVRRLLTEIRDGSFPKGGVLLGAGANYWAQWMTFSRRSPQTLSRLAMPLLLVQCLRDETLPNDTLARNVSILRAVVSIKKTAQLRELRDHDHQGILPGDRQSSSQFMRILVDWLSHESQAARRGAPTDAASPPRR